MNIVEKCYVCKNEFEFDDSEMFYCASCNKSICCYCLEEKYQKEIGEILENDTMCSYCKNK